MSGRRPFTDKEDSFLVQYIAKYCPEDKGRSGQKIYQTLVENSRGVWPWAKSHSAQSWRERYLRKREEFDRRIKKWQAKHLPAPDDTDFGPRSSFGGAYNVPQTPSGQAREPFTTIDDLLLVKYLAIETPDGAHRKGNAVYRHLVSLPDKWPWGTRHTALSWLERYRKRSEIFDAQIRDYQDKHGIQRVGKVRHGLWDKLPRISSEDAQPPQQAKHEGKPKAEPAPQKRKKRPVVDEEDEEDEETDGERRKRRRLEKRRAVEVSEDEGEGEGEEAATPVPRQKKKIIRAVSEAQTGTSEHDAADAERLLHEESLEPQQIADVNDWDAPFPPIEEAIQSKPQKDIGPTQESPNRHGIAGAATQESYVVPSPETLKRSSTRAPAPKISQEPTPPTSDAAHSPRLHTRKYPSPLSHESEKPAASLSRHPDSVHGSPTSQREDGEEEFEAAAPAAQSSVSRRRQPAHHPPKRIEGAFNSAFARSHGTRSYKGARRVSGVDDTTGSDSEAEAESAKDWPPKRGTGKGKVGVVPSVTGQDDAAGSNVLEKDATRSPSRGYAASRSTASPVKNLTRRTLSPSHHEARTETQPPRSYSYSHSTSRTSPQKSAKFADEEIVTPRPRAKVTVVEDQPVAGPSRIEPAITDTAERRHTLATPAAAHRRVQRLKAKARHSMPAYRTRRSSVGPLVSNLSYHGRFITAEDYQHIFEFGIRGILKEIASSTGFTFEVVENVWGLCGTIADTKAMLNRMREKAQKEAGEAYEALDIEEKVQERERAVLEDRHAERVELSVAVGVSGSRMFASSVRRAGIDEGEYWPPEDSKAAILLQQRMEQEEDSEDDEQPGDFLTQEVDAEEQGTGRTNEKDDEEIEDELSEGEPGEKEEEAEEEEETVYMLSRDIEVEEDGQEREGMDIGEVVGEGVENEQENDDEERMAKDREGSIPSEDEDEDADDSYDQEHESLYGNINHILQQVKFGKRQ